MKEEGVHMKDIRRVVGNIRKSLQGRFQNVKSILPLVICLLFLSGVAAVNAQGQQNRIQQKIAKEIIRFHILANSDKEEDQKLKLKVKGEVLSYLQDILKDVDDIKIAREIITQEKHNIELIAKEVIQTEGYQYKVTAMLTTCMFPIKVYGDLTFPAGKYEALRVLIGRAEGKNWWCVMFPSLCFVNETYSVVPKESKEKLRYILPEEEYNALINNPGYQWDDSQEVNDIQVKFKLLEELKKAW